MALSSKFALFYFNTAWVGGFSPWMGMKFEQLLPEIIRRHVHWKMKPDSLTNGAGMLWLEIHAIMLNHCHVHQVKSVFS